MKLIDDKIEQQKEQEAEDKQVEKILKVTPPDERKAIFEISKPALYS